MEPCYSYADMLLGSHSSGSAAGRVEMPVMWNAAGTNGFSDACAGTTCAGAAGDAGTSGGHLMI